MRQDDTARTGQAYEPLSRFRIASAPRLDDALAVMSMRNPKVFSISSAVGSGACEFVVNDSRFAQIGVTFLSYRRQVLVQAHEPTDLNIVWTTTGKGFLTSGSYSLPVSGSHAAVAAPHREYAFNYAEDTGRIAFVIGAGVFEKYLAAALAWCRAVVLRSILRSICPSVLALRWRV
jgi:hypothetical protein